MKLDIRPYQPGDGPKIVALFEKVFKRPMSLAWWEWRYLKNPVDSPLIYLAWEGSTLAAHYAVSPIELRSPTGVVPSSLSMTTMTDPDFGGRGLFRHLAEKTYQMAESRGYDSVIGFPNANSHIPLVEKLSWIDIHAQHTLTAETNSLIKNQDPNDKPECLMISATEVDITKLPDNPDSETIELKWSQDTWNWRFSPESGNIYFATVVMCESQSNYGCVLIWKTYQDHSIDIVYANATSTDFLASALQGLAMIAEQKGVSKLSTWCAISDPLHRSFERCQFTAGGPVTYFGGLPLSERGREITDLDWRMSMIISDVY